MNINMGLGVCIRVGFAGLLMLKSALTPSVAAAAFDEAMRQYQAGNYEQAVTLFRAVLAEEPNRFEAHLNIAISQFHMARFSEAESGFDLCSRLAPQRVEPYFWTGRVSEALNKFDQARAAYRMVLNLDPNNTVASAALAKLEGSKGNPGRFGAGNPGEFPAWAWPLKQWPFYCLLIGLSGVVYAALRKVAPLDRRTKSEMGEVLKGGLGGWIGKRSGIRELEALGGMHARLHLHKSVRAFTTHARRLLLLAVALSSAAAWGIIQSRVWQQGQPEIWWVVAAIGTYLLWKDRWALR